jgi:O-acetyl-ADP-ribose deacetylase (regulator of RNase III)
LYSKEVKKLVQALPCFGTGRRAYPREASCVNALTSVRKWLTKTANADKLDKIVFCVYDEINMRQYLKLLQQYFPLQPDAKVKGGCFTDVFNLSKKST